MKDKTVRHCGHCSNHTLHQVVFHYSSPALWDHIADPYEEEEKLRDMEPILYYLLECSTCKDISLVGGYATELPEKMHDYPLLYPSSIELPDTVPRNIRAVYAEGAEIRHRAPNAFAGQIRKALELLCDDKKALGRDLFHKLQYLGNKGVLPITLTDMASLIRKIGNAGVHSKGEVFFFDAALIDDFFRTVIEYVYIAPVMVESLKNRLEQYKEQSVDSHCKPDIE